MDFLTGTPSSFDQISTQSPGQQALSNQMNQFMGNQGMPQLQKYFQDLMGGDSGDFDAFAAPEMRRFNQETIPGLAEQFAGMGSGASSSSGFEKSLGGAGADLGERLAQLRASLRQNSAQGMQNLYGQSQQQNVENVFRPRTKGLLESSAGAIGAGIGSTFGPAAGAMGYKLGDSLGKKFFGE